MVRLGFVLICLVLPTWALASPSFSGLGTPTLEGPSPPPGLPEPPPDQPELLHPRWNAWTPDGQYATGSQHVLDPNRPPGTLWGHQQAIRWSASGGIELLEPAYEQTVGMDISDDGRFIAIRDMLHVGIGLWEEGKGWERIERAYDDGEARVLGISGDGSVLFGADQGFPPGWQGEMTGWHPFQAAIWTASGELTQLGVLPGGRFQSEALDASFDGSILVGWSDSGAGERAFVWDAVRGTRDLELVLTAIGIDLAGWTLSSAEYVSNDGLTIKGNGLNPSGEPEAWIAVIPEPSTALLVGAGLVALGSSRRGARRDV